MRPTDDEMFITHDVSPQNKRLMGVFGFDEEILYGNQAGLLAERQTRYLWWRFRQHYYDLFIPLIIVMAGIGIDLIFGVRSPFCSVFGVCIAIMGIVAIYHEQHKIYRDLKSPRLECVKGPVWVNHTDDSDYSLHMRDCPHRFKITKRAAAAFIKGDVYTIYYMPISAIILTAEHLPEESPRHPLPPPPRGTRRERRERRQTHESHDTKQKHDHMGRE